MTQRKKKPEDWVDEKRLVDDEAQKPKDWDDEEDGDWEAPMKDNPEYKGDWNANRINNPAYKGFWEAKKIENPDYEDDDNLYKFADFGFIGFDLWQVRGGTIFDNILLTDDVAEADEFAKKWKELSSHEKTKVHGDGAGKFYYVIGGIAVVVVIVVVFFVGKKFVGGSEPEEQPAETNETNESTEAETEPERSVSAEPAPAEKAETHEHNE